MNAEKQNDMKSESAKSHEDTDLVLESTSLFQGRRLIVINHNGEKYRLLETRNGKLILQK